MARFQAQTTPQLEHILDYLSEKLGLPSNKKAELLRELASLSYWMVYQAEHGYMVQAQKGDDIQRLDHPLLHQLTETAEHDEQGVTITLSAQEAQRLSEVLDGKLNVTPALQGIIERVAQKKRHAPQLRWDASE